MRVQLTSAAGFPSPTALMAYSRCPITLSLFYVLFSLSQSLKLRALYSSSTSISLGYFVQHVKIQKRYVDHKMTSKGFFFGGGGEGVKTVEGGGDDQRKKDNYYFVIIIDIMLLLLDYPMSSQGCCSLSPGLAFYHPKPFREKRKALLCKQLPRFHNAELLGSIRTP